MDTQGSSVWKNKQRVLKANFASQSLFQLSKATKEVLFHTRTEVFAEEVTAQSVSRTVTSRALPEEDAGTEKPSDQTA